jgi:hypothetical protein
MSQAESYNEYVKEHPHDHVSKTAFKNLIKASHFQRASGIIDACPICCSKFANDTPESVLAEAEHKDLVRKIGTGLQIIDQHLPRGLFYISYSFKSLF